MPGAKPVSRNIAVTADAANAIATTLYRSPAGIVLGRKIRTTAATPAYLRSAENPVVDRMCDRYRRLLTMEPLSKPLRDCRKEPRPDPEGQDAVNVYRLAADQRVDLGVFGKPAQLFFGESEPPIDGDLENTGDALDKLDLFRAPLDKPRPRTEGSWFIVSGHAIFDSDLHCRHL